MVHHFHDLLSASVVQVPCWGREGEYSEYPMALGTHYPAGKLYSFLFSQADTTGTSGNLQKAQLQPSMGSNSIHQWGYSIKIPLSFSDSATLTLCVLEQATIWLAAQIMDIKMICKQCSTKQILWQRPLIVLNIVFPFFHSWEHSCPA